MSGIQTQEEIWDRGWAPSAKFICSACIDERQIAIALAEHAREDRFCDFCGAPNAAEFDVLLTVFMMGVQHDYREANEEGLPWDGKEGGYQGAKTWDTWDLIHDAYGDLFSVDGVAAEIYSCFEDVTWAVKDGWRLPWDEHLGDAWDAFVIHVRKTSRFHYSASRTSAPYDHTEMSAEQLLAAVASALSELGLVDGASSGFRIYRAQEKLQGSRKWGAKRLGTAPVSHARANRFNPVGIPMFYGAENPGTAAAESGRTSRKRRFVVGEFALQGEMAYLDLTNLPPAPSPFHPTLGHLRRDILFLERFVREISKPASAGDVAAEIEYGPTQVVAAYFLGKRAFGVEIVGIRYASSLEGQPCWVVDIPNERCIDDASEALDPHKPYLRLDGISARRFDSAWSSLRTTISSRFKRPFRPPAAE